MITQFIDILLHLDQYLNLLVNFFQGWTYVILFLIIFCETGLVIFPILPGDSLLFALGALCSTENSTLSYPVLLATLTTAAILGDTVNYSIGHYFCEKMQLLQKMKWIKQDHLQQTQHFYEKHGGKTIIWARFIPIIRTFAPFVAGICKMRYSYFITYNILGGIFWVGSILTLGKIFGDLPMIKNNFHIVIFTLIAVSCIPIMIPTLKKILNKYI